jgi:hypothetical protein
LCACEGSIKTDDGDESECGQEEKDTAGILLRATKQTRRADEQLRHDIEWQTESFFYKKFRL